MVATLFSLVLLLATAGCILLGVLAWRDPDNWHIDDESKELEFHRWLDLGIFAAIGALCLIFGSLGIMF